MTGTGTTLRSSPSLIYLPLLDLKLGGNIRIINAVITVLGRELRASKKRKPKEANTR
jgi:hypothetical protein